MQQPNKLVVGFGNEVRGDDAIGIVIASGLERRAGAFKVARQVGDGLSLLELWEGVDTVIIIDAANSGAAPGTIHRFDAHIEPLPGDLFHCSTHVFGVAEAIELARALDRLPSKVIIYGIEGENFDAGSQLSPALQDAAREVESRVLKDLDAAIYSLESEV